MARNVALPGFGHMLSSSCRTFEDDTTVYIPNRWAGAPSPNGTR